MPRPADPNRRRGPNGGAEPPACDAVRDRLDPFLDGELDDRAEERLRSHLDACPGCREELALAERLRAAMRAGLPALECPPEVTEYVLRAAREEAEAEKAPRDRVEQGGRRRGWSDRLRGWWSAPATPSGGTVRAPAALRWAAVAALLALVVLVPLAVRELASPQPEAARAEAPAGAPQGPGEGPPATEEEYTPEQIARAELEARRVLATVAAVGRDAGETVRREVLAGAVVRPARRAVEGLRETGSDRTRRQP